MLVDFHAHILPGMDHGCDDVATSLGQLKMAAEQKIDLVIATSHFYPYMENVEDFLSRREHAWKKLKTKKKKAYPEIKLGAEVLLCSNIDKMKGIEDLCIENSNVLLIEMPFMRKWDTKLIETVVRLRDEKGLEIILAHAERYPAKEMEKLLEKGFQIQLNVSSIAKLFPSYFVRKSMKRHCVAALGSDIHGLHNSYKAFTKAIKKCGIQADRIMNKTSKLVGIQ